MRISSQQIFDSGVSSMQQHTADVIAAQRQISTGQKYHRASDSALAAGLGVQLSFDRAQFEMYKVNQDHLNQTYANADTQLKSIFDSLAAFQRTMVQAGNGTLSDNDLKTLGAQARNRMESIFGNGTTVTGVIDSKDANGQSIFGMPAVGEVEIAPGIKLANGVSQSEFVNTEVDIKALLERVVGHLQPTAPGQSPTRPSAQDMQDIETALRQVTRVQVKVGLLQNQLDAATQFAESQKLNVETARSNLLDTDLAETTAQLAKSNALLQAAQAIITKLDTNTLFQKL